MEENKEIMENKPEAREQSSSEQTTPEPTPKQQARESFKNHLKQQMMKMGMPPKDMTDEELDQQIKARIESSNNDLKQKEAALKVSETYLARVSANIDLLTNIDLKEAETEWHKKAVQAEINELQAIIAEKEFHLKRDKEGLMQMKESIEKMQELL
jgi:hypothetical protein